MGHGQLYRRDWDTLFQEEKDRDYASYFREKYYPKGFIIALMFLGLMSAGFQLMWLIGGDLQEKELEHATGLRMYEVSVIPRKKDSARPTKKVKKTMVTEGKKLVFSRALASKKDIDPNITECIFPSIEEIRLMKEFFMPRPFILTAEEWLELEEAEVPEVIFAPDPLNQLPVDQEPIPLNLSEVLHVMAYPKILQDAGISGSMTIQILVGRSGKYLSHRIIQSIHPILDQHVEAYLPDLRFSPAMRDGQAVAYWINIPYRICFMH